MRREVKARLAEMTGPERSAASAAACERVIGLGAFERAGVVMGYLAMEGELDVGAVLQAAWAAGKRVCLLRVDWEAGTMEAVAVEPGFETEVRRHGVREPAGGRGGGDGVGGVVIGLDDIGLILTPGLAFDEHGGRLGRGKGFYDRFLGATEMGGARGDGVFLCGVCFELQVVERAPMGTEDVRVDAVVSELRVIEC